MKNLIKKGPTFLRFKAKSFECGEYQLDINGETYDMTLSRFNPYGNKDNREPSHESSYLNFHKELIKEEGDRTGSLRPYVRIDSDKYIPGVSVGISVPAERFQTGEVKIYKDGTRILPADVLMEDTSNWIVDEDKIHLGSIWNLTIDDDPRFQNTTIIILRIYCSCIEFCYQTKVIYTPDYSHTEIAEGRINFNPHSGLEDNFNIEDYLDKIHLTLINDNTNGGADMDRQNESEIIYPRSYSIGGYREEYPPIEFRKRPKRDPEDDEYDEYDDDYE